MKYWRTPLDKNKIKIPHGEAYVIKERCKGCSFCVEFCPKGILKLSDEFNAKGYHSPEITNKDECVNCGLCEMICPEFAIYCLDEEEVQVEG
jgi:2-oxoglutarate ferredoxin oxidoreductase subunit delta